MDDWDRCARLGCANETGMLTEQIALFQRENRLPMRGSPGEPCIHPLTRDSVSPHPPLGDSFAARLDPCAALRVTSFADRHVQIARIVSMNTPTTGPGLKPKDSPRTATVPAELLLRLDPHTHGFLPEGPTRWEKNRFLWVGIQHGADATFGSLNLFDLTTRENQSDTLSGRPGFVCRTDQPDCVLVGLERRLMVYNLATQTETPLTDGIDDDVANTIINDGQCGAQGLLFGTKELTFSKPHAGLYWWPFPKGPLRRVRADQTCSNGKVFLQEDDSTVTVLDIDTPTRRVMRYQLNAADGAILNESIALDLSDEVGFPDGMVGTPDGSGVIIAFFNPEAAAYGRAKWIDLSTGETQMTWTTPGSPQVTCPLLIDTDEGVRLILTTAAEHMTAEQLAENPHAACLFIAPTPFESIPKSAEFPLR